LGAFAADGGLRATAMFTLPESGAGAGTTPIVTVADMLAFGRMHLRGGVAGNGMRVLSAELITAMQTPTYDLGIPQAPPIGLGWWLFPVAGTIAPWHSGGSPGGSSSFCILPDFDATIVSFATGPGGPSLHDRLHRAVIEEISGRQVEPPFGISPTPRIDKSVTGEYASFQKQINIDMKDDDLVVTTSFDPFDEDHRRMWEGFVGGAEAVRAVTTYTKVAPGQYARVDAADSTSLSMFHGRIGLLADLPAAPGRRTGLHSALRYIPRVG